MGERRAQDALLERVNRREVDVVVRERGRAPRAPTAGRSPSSRSHSGETRSGLPAKAERPAYGESCAPGGPSGRTCQILRPAAAAQSRNASAPGPRSPIPKRDGSDVGCRRSPASRVGFFSRARVSGRSPSRGRGSGASCRRAPRPPRGCSRSRSSRACRTARGRRSGGRGRPTRSCGCSGAR